jgi:DNA-binding NtrC family response regulator
VALVVYHRDGARMVALGAGPGIVVGRLPPSDVVIADASLSRQHARFALEGEQVVVEDLASTNGTTLAGEPIERALLQAGDEVVLGGALSVVVHVLEPGAATPSGLDAHERFRAALDQELVRARFFGRKLALCMVRPLGSEMHVRHWLAPLQGPLRPIDRAALYGPATVELVLPEADSDEAVRMCETALERARSVASLGCGIAIYPDAAATLEELVAEARQAMQRASSAQPVQLAPTGRRILGPGDRVTAKPVGDPIQRSASMRGVFRTATRLARGVIPVLIQGETGTGKEVVARFLHDHGPRRERPMVCLNCASIPAQLVESTLFGHERGSFTGATQLQRGIFETADGGTVFLDEVGELSSQAQAAFLRVLETKRLVRIGSTREINLDVRVLAASHRDLGELVSEGRFREDLFYRLNAMTLKIPPLRERPEDIRPLCERFLEEAIRDSGGAITGIDLEAVALLEAYTWPGNARELRNAIERAVLIAQGPQVTLDDLPEAVREARPAVVAQESRDESWRDDEQIDFRTRIERYEMAIIERALRETRGNQTEAARRLQMPLRTLVHKLRVYRMRRPND